MKRSLADKLLAADAFVAQVDVELSLARCAAAVDRVLASAAPSIHNEPGWSPFYGAPRLGRVGQRGQPRVKRQSCSGGTMSDQTDMTQEADPSTDAPAQSKETP